jgi:hypothetical protein
MTDRKRPSKEELEAQLRSEVRRSRPPAVLIFLIFLVLLVGPVAFCVWYFWPQPDPPAVLLTAFDQLAPASQPATLHAQLELLPDEKRDISLANWPMLFQEIQTVPRSGEQALFSRQVRTGAGGSAQVEMMAPEKDWMTDIAVRFVPEGRKSAAEDRARLYSCPANLPLLIVDVEASLTTAPLPKWTTENIRDIAPVEAAFKALQETLTIVKEGHIVYLAGAVERPQEYRKVRGWVQATALTHGLFRLHGPVLGRDLPAESGADSPWLRSRLQAIRQSFSRRPLGVTAHLPTARVFQQEGLQTFLIGNYAAAPEGVILLRSWQQLPERVAAQTQP